MSCFKFPKKVCMELDSMVANFWWGQKGQEGRIHWKAWRSLGKMKSDGGMGFKDWESFNKALLAKSAWRILQNPEALWCRILKGIYFPNEDFMKAKKGSHASWGWSSILEGRELLRDDLCWKVGNGESIKIFADKWIPSIDGYKLRDREVTEEVKELTVNELIVDGMWDLEKVEEFLNEEEMRGIRRIRLSDIQAADKRIWLASRDGDYSVKMGYRGASGNKGVDTRKGPGISYMPSKLLWSGIWNIKMPPKVLHFMWRIVNGAVASREALFRRKCLHSSMGILCNEAVETIEHMLFLCSWAKQCWFGSPLTMMFKEDNIDRYDRWLEKWFSNKEEPDEYNTALFAGLCWGIWKARCRYIFEGVEVDAYGCVARAMRMVRDVWDANERKKTAEKASKGTGKQQF